MSHPGGARVAHGGRAAVGVFARHHPRLRKAAALEAQHHRRLRLLRRVLPRAKPPVPRPPRAHYVQRGLRPPPSVQHPHHLRGACG
eukprot:6899163-Pyramimonas_sp.AAC.2